MVNDNTIMTIATTQILPLISEEIIVYEILKRLPVKSLCRFKAVSKRWLSIINSRPFSDLHLQHSKLNPTRLLVFYNKDTSTTRHPPIFFFSTTTNSPHHTTSSYHWPDTYYRWFSISPRGLICFYNIREDTAVQIWNPSTGEHIELHHPLRRGGKRCPLFLGFDPVSKKHKLLSCSNSDNYVFTLGDNKWMWRKILGDKSSSNLYPTFWGDYCIDGVVYYLARCDEINADEKVLMRFRVGSESFLEPIRLPGELVRFPHHGKYSGIYVYRGRILLVNKHAVTYGYQMWVLENDKWSPKRLIPPPPASVPENKYSVGFIDGEDLIFYSSQLDGRNFRLCSYDLEKCSGWTEETIFSDLNQKLDAARYEMSFYYYVNTLDSPIQKNRRRAGMAGI